MDKDKIDRFLASKDPKLLVPPVPISRNTQADVNWPQLQTEEKIFAHTTMENVPDHVPQQYIEQDPAASGDPFQDATGDDLADMNMDSVGDGWEEIGTTAIELIS